MPKASAATSSPCRPTRNSSSNGCRSRWRDPRSEEHTSELQSQSNLVCRLLLEKKKDYAPLRYLRRSAFQHPLVCLRLVDDTRAQTRHVGTSMTLSPRQAGHLHVVVRRYAVSYS